MKKIILTIPILLLLLVQAQAQEDFRKSAPKPGPAPKVEMGKYEQFTLDNGLKVIVVENHKLPRVTYRLFVDVPPLLEGDKAGAADMAGQLLKTGTTTKTKAQIDEAVDFIGATLSTGSSGIIGASLTKHQDKLLEIMADVLYNPSFPQEEFDKLKRQTLSGLATNKDNPNAIAANVAQVMRFGKAHPYGELTTENTVDQITMEDCRTFYSTYFKPNISYLVIVGDVQAAEAKKIATKYFGKWVKGEVARPTLPKPAQPEATKVAFVNKTGAVQSIINITYPVDINQRNPEYIKAFMANVVLGGYFGSRLSANIREDKGYTYGAGSSLIPDLEIGYFNASASVRNEVTDSALVEFLYEMKRLQEELIPAAELALVKNERTGSFARQLEQPSTIAQFALNIARFGLPEDYYTTYLEKLNSVTAEEIRAMAKKYITPDKATILVVGNKNDVAEKLTRFAANGKIDYYDYYGNKIETGSVSVPTDLTAQQVIDNYVKAIGGKEKLMQVQDVTMTMKTSLQGMSFESIMQQKATGKLALSVVMNGMTMQEQRFDGEKGMVAQMGQKQPVEGKDLESLRRQAIPFSEMHYAKLGYQLSLKGIEQVEGKNAYQIEVKVSDTDIVTEFYDTETGLKIRAITVVSGGGNTATIINDLSDYKEVNGILFPHTVVVTGAAPVPLKSEVTDIKINTGLDDSVFKVE
ncbi:MAG TPA: insulinase family protein [Saprospiraceae bacterium]|nr:insulinase family protein [Saprospiraceae bacterium]HMP24990.1 insulinase family protein [Saprospiraceae bacterium]